MNTNTLIAIVLIVLGVIAFGYQGITYKTKEKAVDLGPIQITTEETHHVPLLPIAGGIALVGGIIALAMGRSRA